jgi:U4/U6 small nuclear ribonucleoprotein PRP3
MNTEALIAQKKAEIAAKLAAMKKGAIPSAGQSPSPVPNGGSGGMSRGAMSDLATRISEAKAKVAAAQNRVASNSVRTLCER